MITLYEIIKMTGISPRNLEFDEVEVDGGANLENLPKMDLTNFTNKLEPEIVRSGQSPQDNYNFFGSGGITCPCGFGLRGKHRLLDSDDEMPSSPELDLMLEPERPDPEDELKKLKLSKNFTIDYYAGKPNRKLKKKLEETYYDVPDHADVALRSSPHLPTVSGENPCETTIDGDFVKSESK